MDPYNNAASRPLTVTATEISAPVDELETTFNKSLRQLEALRALIHARNHKRAQENIAQENIGRADATLELAKANARAAGLLPGVVS